MTAQTAIQATRMTPEMEQIRCDAMRYLDRYHPDATTDDLARTMAALAQKAFLQAIEPMMKAKTDMVVRGIGAYAVHADGTVEHILPPMTPVEKTTSDLLDELIENERKRFQLSSA